MKRMIVVLATILLPLLQCYGGDILYEECRFPVNTESTLEILTVKCEHQILGYVLAALERHGFKLISISYNETIDSVWVVNYSN